MIRLLLTLLCLATASYSVGEYTTNNIGDWDVLITYVDYINDDKINQRSLLLNILGELL